MGDSDTSRESGSNFVKFIGTFATLLTAITGFLALYWQHQPAKTNADAPASQGVAVPTEAKPSPSSSTVTKTSVPRISVPETTVPQRVQQPPVRSVNLTGVWVEPGGNPVTIHQNGDSLTMRMPFVEQFLIQRGISPALMQLTGAVQDCDDGAHLAHLSASSPAGMTASFYLNLGGTRLDGMVNNGFASSPVALIRSR